MIAGRRMGPSYGPSERAASVRDALRALRESGVGATARGAPLEVLPRADEPPRLAAATPLEGDRIGIRWIADPPVSGVAAFLDGIQRSRVLAHAGPVPIVHGAVVAAVRERVDRRLRTWARPVVSQALSVPLGLLDAGVAASLRSRCALGDPFAEEPEGAGPARHPQEYTARALTAVQRARRRRPPSGGRRRREVAPDALRGR